MSDEICESQDQDAVLTILTTDDLHAYIDGELDTSFVSELESILEEDPRAARWVAAYRHQIACMHRVFAAGAENVPDRLRNMVRAAVAAGQ